MKRKNLPDFSEDQWMFLAVLDAVEGDAPVALIGQLAPLSPGPLLNLINKAKKLGWLIQKNEETFSLSKKLPPMAKKKLSEINTPDHLAEIADRLRELKIGKTAPQLIARLMRKAGSGKEASQQLITSAEMALNDGNQAKAWEYFKLAADQLAEAMDLSDVKNTYLCIVLKFSNLSFLIGKGLTSLEKYLHKAHEVAYQIGDKRSHAMINMHLGRLYYFSDRRADAMAALSIGLNEVEELGDEDILEQSAGFMGIYYLMQGLFKEALPHLERSASSYMGQKQLQQANPMAPVLSAYCLAYLGEFHRAIGGLECNWRMAKEKADHSMATTLRIILSTILYLINRFKEAEFHLAEGLREAEIHKNRFAQYLSAAPKIWKHMKSDGGTAKAYEILLNACNEAISFGFARQFASPWVMEMIFDFERLGFKPIPQMGFHELWQRAVNENNIHLQGVALRLKASQKFIQNECLESILSDLESSRNYLERSGDVVQLARTLIETGRIELSRSNRKKGVNYLKQAWVVLGGYADIFFPEELMHFLDMGGKGKNTTGNPQESVNKFIELTESIFPLYEQDEILTKTVLATNRFFAAERGALFWFPGGKITDKPELRASCNISMVDIQSDYFNQILAIIVQTFKSKNPVIKRNILYQSGNLVRAVKSVLCIPVEVRGKFRAVLYHDNSYLEDCFDFLDAPTLANMMRHVSLQIERIYDYFRLKQERNSLIGEKALQDEALEEKGFIYKCQIMKDLMHQIDAVAKSDSTILLLGETGVGKEIIARHIHSMSPRRNSPFIIVDAVSIPENLIESELFGHEKGAYTGAVSQKNGRLELANKGTLFVDEVGELPKSIQVKFLRAIQERHFYRLGGNRLHQSDFRLIAATNRNLAEEVARGRFREDLYYRLNVVPLRIPPLRERIEDIPLIAEYFMKKFTRKYNRPRLPIDAEIRKKLQTYHWPGNARELENLMERSILLSDDFHLEIDFSKGTGQQDHSFADLTTLAEMERRYIQFVLQKTGGKVGGPGGASEILGINRTTLNSRMRRLGIK